MDMIN